MPNVLDVEETEEALIENQESPVVSTYDACAQSDAPEECQLSSGKPIDVLVRTHPYIYVDALLG